MTRLCVQATWDDVPHLSEQQKEEQWASIPPHQRDARAKGIPQLGVGVIYPVSEAEILIEPFEIPEYWKRCYGLDVGWNCTAAIWGALDPEDDVLYLYSEYYRGQAEPAIHAAGIRTRGLWIPGAIDPAARGRSQVDGTQILQQYREFGLNLTEADNAVEAGIYAVWERLSDKRLRVFKTLHNWLGEYRIYRRDDRGKPVKENDHLMDATRYLVMTGVHLAEIEPRPIGGFEGEATWADRTRSSVTGY